MYYFYRNRIHENLVCWFFFIVIGKCPRVKQAERRCGRGNAMNCVIFKDAYVVFMWNLRKTSQQPLCLYRQNFSLQFIGCGRSHTKEIQHISWIVKTNVRILRTMHVPVPKKKSSPSVFIGKEERKKPKNSVKGYLTGIKIKMINIQHEIWRVHHRESKKQNRVRSTPAHQTISVYPGVWHIIRKLLSVNSQQWKRCVTMLTKAAYGKNA